MSDEQLTTVRGAGEGATRPRASDATPIGTNIGRYVTLAVAGRGASGIVYAAYDPELDRKVALKVLGSPGDDEDGGSTRAEVLHEARALARLRDQNVVAVHDVGEHEHGVFVVMEFVDGRDLGEWIEAQRRRPVDVLEAMAQAARGLRAAHDEGIIHRDFKPANVLIDADDKVLVADFGLAKLAGRRAEAVAEIEPSVEASGPPGTPAYLAPELYDGRLADVRSDVYAFCVTLWEALFAERPWLAQTEMALVEAKRGGPPTLPTRPRIPSRVKALLRSGLSPDPGLRPASMTAVLRDLEPRSSRLPAAVATGFVAVAVVSAWALTQPDPCDGAHARTAAVWSSSHRAELEVAMPDPDSWSFFAAQADGFIGSWMAGYRDACEATHVRHEQSSERLDRRMVCLDRKLVQFGTLLHEIDPHSQQEVGTATRALARLSTQLACDGASEDFEVPRGSVPDDIVADLDRVEVLETLARYDDAMQLAREARKAAETASITYLEVLGDYRVGRLLDLTNEHEAAVETLAGVHHRAEGEGWNELSILAGTYVVYEYAAVFNMPARALAWEPHVASAVRRAGDSAQHRAALLDNVGVALLYANRHEDALVNHQQALELREGMADDWLGLVGTLGNLGILYEEMGRSADAIAQQERALVILIDNLGEVHPHTARVLDNLGTAHLRNGDIAIAKGHFERVLAIRERILGRGHRSVGLSHVHLALAHLQAGDASTALKHYDAGLEIYEQVFDDDSLRLLQCREGRAHAYASLERWEEARVEAEAALAGLQGRLPPDHPEIGALRDVVERAEAAMVAP